ncbi:alanine racemase [Draconibacterium sp. IB214405]|uniref:alanine racemase n=1 Tax=Draconibacterium sp. IB214405 TaxID=3097352 RepID=UPI002A0DD30F|nr:alanine racemase [Draconibacterium sp. IB214405]MDX8340934.1 alanine racemase [Draconibacterium sp. IB214405]
MTEITRPTLIIDKEICLQNIERMAKKAEKHKLRLRPHFKTHQAAKVGEWFKQFGISQITVSSVSMAEYFASNGWSDITLAFPLNILEISRINRLADSIKLNVLVENREAAEVLALKASKKIGVFLKIDTGYNRTGIPAGRTGRIDSILDILSKNSKLTFKGFLTHTGHTYTARSTNEIFSSHFDALLKLKQLRNRYQKNYPGMELSMGDTPSASICGNFDGVDELRPGNFVFYDLTQHKLGVCEISDIAVKVVCPVVAKHVSRNEIVIYGGAVHLSKDTLQNTDGKELYGRVIINHDGEKVLLDTKNYLTRLSQEHGIIKVTPANFKLINVGDLVEIIPVHSCLTANILGHMITSEGEFIEMMPKY